MTTRTEHSSSHHLQTIDFLAGSRSSTCAGPRWADDETVGCAGVWVAATTELLVGDIVVTPSPDPSEGLRALTGPALRVRSDKLERVFEGAGGRLASSILG